jgi:16S rRNA (guanine(966)-N(2))-methyltransferase RsmD
MRVIAGQYRSRRLQSLPGMDIRPTADRLRETLFNVLTAGNPEALQRAIWIDLFAGTGAVGIEALSRGAEKIYFVEVGAAASDLIRKNLHSLGVQKGFEILKLDAQRALKQLDARGTQADFVFIDPPYDLENAYVETLQTLAGSQLLKPEALVIAEHRKQFDPGEEFGSLHRYRTLKQGDATLSFYRKT